MGYFMVNLFGFSGIIRAIVILDSAMPGEVQTTILAAEYKHEEELVTNVVFLTTITS